MLDYLKQMFGENNEQVESAQDIAPSDIEFKKLQIATCALFLEVAFVDDEFLFEEQKEIISIMKKTFDLDSEHVELLMQASASTVERSASLYDFTSVINEYCSYEQKYNILKNLWKLIYVDHRLDAYEDNFIRKITGNLQLSHNDMIAAKLEAKKEMK